MAQKQKKEKKRATACVFPEADEQMLCLLKSRLGFYELATLASLSPKELHQTVQKAYFITPFPKVPSLSRKTR